MGAATERMAHDPAIAVIVISVGAPPELSGAVQSVIELDTHCEIIVVNTGGGDVSRRLEPFLHKRSLTVIAHDSTLWVGAARNLGITASKAPYIAFLAADCRVSPGWLDKRLALHRQGHPLVASAVVGTQGWNPFAWASHFALYSNRLPDTPRHEVSLYGASYDRRLFDQYGLFRGDLRIGEDSEFFQRLPKHTKPFWAPDIITIHLSPTNPISMLTDQYRRGLRAGKWWPQVYRGGLNRRSYSRILWLLKKLFSGDYSRTTRAQILLWFPIHLSNTILFEWGVKQGKKHIPSLTELAKATRKSENLKAWVRPLINKAQPLKRHLGAGQNWLFLADKSARSYQWQEALRAYQKARELMPQASAPIQGMAHAALALNEVTTAMQMHDILWRRFGQPYALVQKLELLLKHGQHDDAQAFVTHVQSDQYAAVDKVLAQVTLLQWYNSWQAIDKLLTKYAAIVEHSRLLQNLHLESLCILNRQDQALWLISRLKLANAEKSRLTLNTLLRFGEYGEAQILLTEKLKNNATSNINIFDAGALVLNTFKQNGLEQSYKVLATLANKPITNTCTATLVLVLPYQRLRLDSLAWLAGQEIKAGGPKFAAEQAVLKTLGAKRPKYFAHGACEAIQTVGNTICKIGRSSNSLYLNPLYSFNDTMAVVWKIVDAIDNKRPLSLIRLGDGEGRFMPCSATELQALLATDRLLAAKTWWGQPEAATSVSDDLSHMLCAATQSADIIGIPDLPRFIRDASTGLQDPNTAVSASARGMYVAFDYVSKKILQSIDQARTTPLVTSCHIHEALEFWALWPALLRHMKEVSLITCHPQLADKLQTNFGTATKQLLHIPTEHRYADLFGYAATHEPHYPNVFQPIMTKLATVTAGQVWLVAAGALGKAYCHRIRELGGIAIDVGSIADHWCGYSTRGYEAVAAYKNPLHLAPLYESLARRNKRFERFWLGAAA